MVTVPPRVMLPLLSAAVPEALLALSAAIPGYCVLRRGYHTFTLLISGTLRQSQVVAGQPGMMPQ